MLVEILLGVLGNLATDVVRKAVTLARPPHNYDLQQAFAAAFAEAFRRLTREQGWTEDGRRILQQLHAYARALFPVDSETFPQPVLDALLVGDEACLRQALHTCLAPRLAAEPQEFQIELEGHLAKALLAAFGDTLKEEKHQRGWIAFQRELLQKTYRLMQEQTATIAANQRQGFAETLKRLDALASDTALLTRTAQTIAETLAGIGRLEAQTQTLAELIQQATAAQQARFDALELAIRRRPLYEHYAGREVADRVEELLRDYTTLFVGRERGTGSTGCLAFRETIGRADRDGEGRLRQDRAARELGDDAAR